MRLNETIFYSHQGNIYSFIYVGKEKEENRIGAEGEEQRIME